MYKSQCKKAVSPLTTSKMKTQMSVNKKPKDCQVPAINKIKAEVKHVIQYIHLDKSLI